ncbi:hypothetical protein NGM37_25625, partial [Streptomyces sp. TRM76130]|nr:hypothetical protein [Streptomyces sp. TRM76130]
MASVAAGRGDEEALNELSDEIAAWAVPRRFMLMVASLRETRARIAIGRGDFEEAFRQAALLTPPGE